MSGFMWGAFTVILIIALSIGGAATIYKVMEGVKECKVNSDCDDDSYCGSDFKCHSYPNIERTIVQTDWKTPAAIVGLAVILAALILRKKQQPKQAYY